jgi:hypothetical protein
MKSSCSGSRNARLTAVGIRRADTLYLRKLALTSLTSGGRLIFIVRLRTKATEFSLVCSVAKTINRRMISE